ncbi:L-seryl-tRNA(Sec) kinase isoform X2 [Peromyscus californicus insignis]|uniref:L-seryl-tRNA(Sec) kinase isoform X2 n=1 Tax=Peromyscus californicus insignis TaxID=564181 RepID=UPI0022A79E01|nr:L-seryl-tRNA(Sec) kinase isoform X2 [Peromyscus californicus insignis]
MGGRSWDCVSSAACRRRESRPSRVLWPSGCGRSGAGPWASSPTTICCPPRSRTALAHSFGSAPSRWGGQPSQWKMFRQELLKHLECFLVAVISGGQMSAPPNRSEAVWEDFITCLKNQYLIISAAHEAQPCHLLAKTAVSRPLFLVLDDNFYYQSMRYEVYQLARKCQKRAPDLIAGGCEPPCGFWELNSGPLEEQPVLLTTEPSPQPSIIFLYMETSIRICQITAAFNSLGFCQLFLDCPLETCLLRNGQRPQPLPNETIHLMEKKIEKPDPEKNAWEHNSLTIQSSACSLEASLEVTDLLLTALENPIKCAEDNTEQKETDRLICSTNILHKADETFRRTISQTMKEAKDEQIPLNNLKRLAEELNKLKADFLEDLRRGNRKYLCFQHTTDLSDVISSFCDERDTVVQKYFSKQH